MGKTLNDYVKDNSKFLRLADGESFEGTFVAYKVTASTFDPEKETVVYKLKYKDGKETYWQTASAAVAKAFSKFKGGEAVSITRKGDGPSTRWDIKSPEAGIDVDSDLAPDEDVPEEWK
jgi:hypothetical protein